MLIEHADEEFVDEEFVDEEFESPEKLVEPAEQQDSIHEQPDESPPRKAKRKVLTDLISPKPKKVRKLAAAEIACGVCSKKFRRSDNLKRHTTKAHS